jgi:hypothetical protein
MIEDVNRPDLVCEVAIQETEDGIEQLPLDFRVDFDLYDFTHASRQLDPARVT